MPVITEPLVREALSKVRYPGFSRDIVSFGLLKDIRIQGSDVFVQLTLTTSDPSVPEKIKEQAEAELNALAGIGSTTVKIDIHAPAQPAASGGNMTKIEGVKH